MTDPLNDRVAAAREDYIAATVELVEALTDRLIADLLAITEERDEEAMGAAA